MGLQVVITRNSVVLRRCEGPRCGHPRQALVVRAGKEAGRAVHIAGKHRWLRDPDDPDGALMVEGVCPRPHCRHPYTFRGIVALIEGALEDAKDSEKTHEKGADTARAPDDGR